MRVGVAEDLKKSQPDADGHRNDGEQDGGVVDVAGLIVTGEPVEVADFGQDLFETFRQPVLAVEGSQYLVGDAVGAQVLPPQPVSKVGDPSFKSCHCRVSQGD